MYKITAIRNTQSAGWVADVFLFSCSILPISVSVSKLSVGDLVKFANTDSEHIAYGDSRTPEQIEMDMFSSEWEKTYQSLYGEIK